LSCEPNTTLKLGVPGVTLAPLTTKFVGGVWVAGIATKWQFVHWAVSPPTSPVVMYPQETNGATKSLFQPSVLPEPMAMLPGYARADGSPPTKVAIATIAHRKSHEMSPRFRARDAMGNMTIARFQRQSRTSRRAAPHVTGRFRDGGNCTLVECVLRSGVMEQLRKVARPALMGFVVGLFVMAGVAWVVISVVDDR
jgi:hypothetical protein